MSDQKHLIDEYTDLAIQFGYVTMFATAFPPASILFMINCYMDLRFSLHNYTNVVKREVNEILIIASPPLTQFGNLDKYLQHD